ncbi:unnamed protein product [Cladocopium goreaui]|uniref:Uncharacterized protein n=1 Tax=Cladocopium goreaui TaxID=2562237 RepID=A0A9P1GTU6_9DINO|nr:unnamed protein product [Cladocopium goreaui]
MSDSPPALASSPASPVADSSEWMHVGPEMGEAEYVVALQKLGIQMAASIPQKLQERADTQTKMKNTVGKVQKLWMWQNSPDASRSPWVQKIKDFMEKAQDDPTPVGKGAEPDSDVSSNIWGDQQLQLVLADDIGLEGASKEPAASCDQGADGAGHEGESHEPGSKHIEAANALFTDEDPEAFKDALNEIKPEPVDVEPAHGSKSKKRKSKSKSKSKSRTKRAKGGHDTSTEARAGSVDREQVLQSFDQKYQDVIKSLPHVLWPTSTKHGEHSYTATLIFQPKNTL